MDNNLKVPPTDGKRDRTRHRNHFNFFKKIDWLRLFWTILKMIGKVFAGAIILSFLRNLTPELQEQLPYLYKGVDSLLYLLEWMLQYLPL